MSLETTKRKNKQKYTLQPKTKTLHGARANGFGRQLIQKIRSIQKKNPNVQLTADLQVAGEKEAKKTEKKVKKEKEGLQNPAFDPFYVDVALEKHSLETIEENEDESLVKSFEQEKAVTPIVNKKKRKLQEAEKEENVQEESTEVPVTKKKKKRKTEHYEGGFVNVGLDLEGGESGRGKNNAMEVQRGRGLTNPAFEEPILDDSDLILNVTATPPPPKPEKTKTGYTNHGFNPTKNTQQLVINARNEMENCGAQVENEINEMKYPVVGEMDGAEGENEKLAEGTKLRYKYANFSHRTPYYQLKTTGPKKSYKHLIKGDILVGFKNTNLHEIEGYAAKKPQTLNETDDYKSRVRRIATVATSLRRTAVVQPATVVTRSTAPPVENGVRGAKQFVGKSRVPRFQNRSYAMENPGFCEQDQEQVHFDGQERGDFQENYGTFGLNQQNLKPNQRNFGPNQFYNKPPKGTFYNNQQKFQGNYGFQNQQYT